ncbi:acyltransferase [Klebsiella pneumoniae]|nr:acyltransferase [Klebsiella pneumoniae]
MHNDEVKKPIDIKAHQDNCFDFIRHIAALAVLVSHHFALTGRSEPYLFGGVKLGTAAVVVFFAISGYLITKSFCRSSSLVSYFKKRMFRIFPALVVCSFFIVFFVCGLWGNKEILPWVLSVRSMESFLSFSLFMLPHNAEAINFFSNNYIYPNALNGSLWSLKFEFIDYVLVFVIFFFFRNKFKVIGGVSFLLGAIVVLWLNTKFNISTYYLDRLALLSIPFATDSLLYTLEDCWKHTKIKIYLMAIFFLVLIFIQAEDEYDIPLLIILSSFIIFLGFSFHDKLLSGKFDISYGIYIYAFPVQQLVINEITSDFFISIFISVVLTLILALFSWHFVEKKFIFNKSR